MLIYIQGVGNGFLTSMIPIYVAEMAVAVNKRGQGVNMMIAAASLGTALAYWVYVYPRTSQWYFLIFLVISGWSSHPPKLSGDSQSHSKLFGRLPLSQSSTQCLVRAAPLRYRLEN